MCDVCRWCFGVSLHNLCTHTTTVLVPCIHPWLIHFALFIAITLVHFLLVLFHSRQIPTLPRCASMKCYVWSIENFCIAPRKMETNYDLMAIAIQYSWDIEHRAQHSRLDLTVAISRSKFLNAFVASVNDMMYWLLLMQNTSSIRFFVSLITSSLVVLHCCLCI